MPKVVVLAFSSTKKALPLVEKHLRAGAQVVLITKGDDVPSEVKRRTGARLFDDYLAPHDDDDINESTMKAMAEGLPYFRSHPELAPTYREIRLWDVTLWPAFRLYQEVEKHARITRNIIGQEKPDRIVILSAPGNWLFWHELQGVVQSGWMSKLGFWLMNSGDGTLGSWTTGEIAQEQHIPVTLVRPGRLLSSNLHRRLASHLVPPLLRLAARVSEFRKSRLPVSPAAPVPGRRPICLITQSRGHVKAMAPLARQLGRENYPFLIVNIDGHFKSSARPALIAESLPFSNHDRYLTKEGRKRAKAGAREATRLWRRLEKDSEFIRCLEWKGIPLGEAAKGRFFYMFTLLFPEVVKHIERAYEILDREKPGAIVLADDSSITERSFALAARARGVPTIQTTYSYYSSSSVVGSIDQTAAWGPAVKDFLVEHGLAPKDGIQITGNQVSEAERLRVASLSKADILKKLGVGEGKSVVFFASQAVHPPAITVELYDWLLQCVYVAVKQLPEYHFIVKLHPGEEFDSHYRCRSKMGIENVTLVRDWNLYELLKVCDVQVSCLSVTALEAMTMDKPVINIQLPGRGDALPYTERGAALAVRSTEELVAAIRLVLVDENTRQRLKLARSRFVLDYDGPQDGLAAKRLADLALGMAGR